MIELARNESITSDQPLITVAMPIYNAGKYLRYAVLSIVNQTYQNWELLLIDDGSSDDSLDSIADIKDTRIIIIKDNLNQGLANRLNQAIDMARGDYFARMDQDDIAFSNRFEKQLEILLNDKSIDLNAVQAITIDNENRVIGDLRIPQKHDEICAMPWRSIHMSHPTWMGKIQWFKKYHYSYNKPYCSEDQELLLRTYRESKFSSSNEILFAYRVRRSNNFIKLIKTRFAMLKFQSNYFLHAKQFIYLFLSILSFVLRLFLDAFNMLRKKPFYPYKLISPTDLAVTEFQKLMQQITK